MAKNHELNGALVLAHCRKKRPNTSKGMKRLRNLYSKIISIENLQLADEKARKGKGGQYGIEAHDRNREANLQALHQMLRDKTYRTSPYDVFTVFETKEREVYRLPYFPDRITHHAIMNVLEPVFVSVFTADTYSCIKGKGIHAASNAVKKAVGVISTYIRKPDQIINPYYFGDNVPKKTCLWLKNLPPLVHAQNDTLFETKTHVEPEYVVYNSKKSKSGKSKYSVFGKLGGGHGKTRSKTFPGIAKAMAEQWG